MYSCLFQDYIAYLRLPHALVWFGKSSSGSTQLPLLFCSRFLWDSHGLKKSHPAVLPRQVQFDGSHISMKREHSNSLHWTMLSCNYTWTGKILDVPYDIIFSWHAGHFSPFNSSCLGTILQASWMHLVASESKSHRLSDDKLYSAAVRKCSKIFSDFYICVDRQPHYQVC